MKDCKALAALFVVSGVLFTSCDAAATGLGAAGGVGQVMTNTVAASAYLPGLFSGLAYLFGVVLGALAVADLYEYGQNPHHKPIWDGLKKLIAGGAFFALPTVINAAIVTVRGDVGGVHEFSGFAGDVQDAGGLDAMLVRLMGDIWMPAHWLLAGFCYLAGVVLVMVGISRLLKSAQDGPRGPGGLGTVMTFIVAGALLSCNSMMAAFSESMFGTATTASYATLVYDDDAMTAGYAAHVVAVLSALVAFVALLGWVSFIRGFFILRGVADGKENPSMTAGVTHLFGGALAVNLGPVINAVQETLDIRDFGIMFGDG